ncbi:hypothetical protein [Streptomyces melanogenes]|uniref:hypothetical protein n=1 Tax=Streptomyces melanogenes TaxID=67326 RepID=UPI003789C8B7
MIPRPYRMKGAVELGARRPGEEGPFGPYGADAPQDEEQGKADAVPTATAPPGAVSLTPCGDGADGG